jgi:AcrR family transcriptional regulator
MPRRPSSPAPPAPSARAPRRDAQRNRAHLIAVATTAFQEQGLTIGVDEIARRAGVGIATLYRHFPTKGDLVVAVSATLLETLRPTRDAILASPPADTALARFLRAALASQEANRGLVEALAHQLDPEIRGRLRAMMLELLEPLVAHAHASGELHRSLDAEDLVIANRMLGAAATPDVPRPPERYLALLLAGLRAGAPAAG